jgi:hypothetical protein
MKLVRAVEKTLVSVVTDDKGRQAGNKFSRLNQLARFTGEKRFLHVTRIVGRLPNSWKGKQA